MTSRVLVSPTVHFHPCTYAAPDRQAGIGLGSPHVRGRGPPDQQSEPAKAVWGLADLGGDLRVFEQAVIWPREKPSPTTMQHYRAMLTAILALGGQLLGSHLDPEDKEVVQATAETLREKLILEFSGANPAQSQNLLDTIFELGTTMAWSHLPCPTRKIYKLS